MKEDLILRKNVVICSFCGPYFLSSKLNTGPNTVKSDQKTPNTDAFCAV